MNDRVAEAIKHRHPKERVFFWLIALLTVAAGLACGDSVPTPTQTLAPVLTAAPTATPISTPMPSPTPTATPTPIQLPPLPTVAPTSAAEFEEAPEQVREGQLRGIIPASEYLTMTPEEFAERLREDGYDETVIATAVANKHDNQEVQAARLARWREAEVHWEY